MLDFVSKYGIIGYVTRGNTMRLRAISTRLSDEQIKQGKEKAQAEGTTLSQKVRWFVAQWLEQEQQEQEATDDNRQPHQ